MATMFVKAYSTHATVEKPKQFAHFVVVVVALYCLPIVASVPFRKLLLYRTLHRQIYIVLTIRFFFWASAYKLF